MRAVENDYCRYRNITAKLAQILLRAKFIYMLYSIFFLISRIPLSQDRFLTGSVKTDSGESLMIRRYQTLFYGNYSSYFLIMSAALCPPKPNVLLSAALMSRFFALLKVKSMV